MKSIDREFYRFIFWGGVNTCLGYLMYAFLLPFVPYLVSYSIAFVVSIVISYFLHSKLVFKQELRLSKALKYPLVYITQYVLGTVSLYLLVQLVGVNKLIAPALVVLLTIPVTYTLSRRIVGGSRKTVKANAEQPVSRVSE